MPKRRVAKQAVKLTDDEERKQKNVEKDQEIQELRERLSEILGRPRPFEMKIHKDGKKCLPYESHMNKLRIELEQQQSLLDAFEASVKDKDKPKYLRLLKEDTTTLVDLL